MSTFTYTVNLPVSTNSPSVDQPNMTINNQSAAGIWDIDHIGFNNSQGGWHQQVTFNDNNVPATPTDPQSILYTDQGTSSTDAQLHWVNANMTLPVSPVKSAGWYTVSGGVVTSVQSFNVVSVVRASSGVFNVTLESGAVSTSAYGVVCSCLGTGSSGVLHTCEYKITGAQTFTIYCYLISSLTVAIQDPSGFTFQVMQV